MLSNAPVTLSDSVVELHGTAVALLNLDIRGHASRLQARKLRLDQVVYEPFLCLAQIVGATLANLSMPVGSRRDAQIRTACLRIRVSFTRGSSRRCLQS
jgi:hypothetical protein